MASVRSGAAPERTSPNPVIPAAQASAPNAPVPPSSRWMPYSTRSAAGVAAWSIRRRSSPPGSARAWASAVAASTPDRNDIRVRRSRGSANTHSGTRTGAGGAHPAMA